MTMANDGKLIVQASNEIIEVSLFEHTCFMNSAEQEPTSTAY